MPCARQDDACSCQPWLHSKPPQSLVLEKTTACLLAIRPWAGVGRAVLLRPRLGSVPWPWSAGSTKSKRLPHPGPAPRLGAARSPHGVLSLWTLGLRVPGGQNRRPPAFPAPCGSSACTRLSERHVAAENRPSARPRSLSSCLERGFASVACERPGGPRLTRAEGWHCPPGVPSLPTGCPQGSAPEACAAGGLGQPDRSR